MLRLVLCCLLAAGVAAKQLALRSDLSPISRVVELLQDLAKQVEADGKKEEELYETFVCWAKSITAQKTASNAAATTRIAELDTYQRTLAAGGIELTSERSELQKEIETIQGDLQVAADFRKRGAADFETAREDMQNAIDALYAALDVLRAATAPHRGGALVRLRGAASATSATRAQEAAHLRFAAELGRKALTPGDAVFLQRLLIGEVPAPDRKKLNRKANFKMSYKARSEKIQSWLEKMRATFEESLEEAIRKEDAAIAQHDRLAQAKQEELFAAQDALTRMDRENGAKGLSLDQAVEQIDALHQQVQDDGAYIIQVQDALSLKKVEWQERQALRAGELEAISRAVSVLHSGGARDTFKKSFASQGLLFLQREASSGSAQRRCSLAVAVLSRAAVRTSDHRVRAVADLVSGDVGHFNEVLVAIDNMLNLLRAEEAEDLNIKENCEHDRAFDTRNAITASRTMDEHSENIVRSQAKAAEFTSQIAEKEELLKKVEQQLAETTEQRNKETAEYFASKKDDEEAAALIEEAIQTIESFYAANGLMLAQHGKQATFESVAGKAPPPPPATWDGGYGGKTSEATGIISLLNVIHGEVLKDMAKAESEEHKTDQLFMKTMSELEHRREALLEEVSSLDYNRAHAETDVAENKNGRAILKGEVDFQIQKIKDAEPGCAFFQINYPLRVRNRQLEMDSLLNARAILAGGRLPSPQDAGREMRPGDAFVQRPSFLAAPRRAA